VDAVLTCNADAPTRTRKPVTGATKAINLALQGGGTHGAFKWGVLDRLLEENWVEIEGISATSAGVMDATVLAYGFATGGCDGARAALAAFLEAPQPYCNDFAAKREPARLRLRQSVASLFALAFDLVTSCSRLMNSIHSISIR
jgi:predicted acylesterase/phospholipase RssA